MRISDWKTDESRAVFNLMSNPHSEIRIPQ